MEIKDYKKLYGCVLYELQELGFYIDIKKFENFHQFFCISNKYLQDFCFVLHSYTHYSNSGRTALCLYAVPKYLYEYVSTDSLETDCWLRYCFSVDTELRLVNSSSLVKFLKTFKRNKYFYFYNALIDNYSVNKKPSKLAMKKLYKKIKRKTKKKPTK